MVLAGTFVVISGRLLVAGVFAFISGTLLTAGGLVDCISVGVFGLF